jgi:hypothetical protein
MPDRRQNGSLDMALLSVTVRCNCALCHQTFGKSRSYQCMSTSWAFCVYVELDPHDLGRGCAGTSLSLATVHTRWCSGVGWPDRIK